jgi:lipid-binding SYLF domain-containing protein
MKSKTLLALMLVAAVVTGCRTAKGNSPSEKRAYVLQTRDEALAKLYESEPGAKAKIADAAGYGVFSNVGINLFLLASGNGFGVVRNNSSGQDTYMKMREIGVGVGMGVKDFRAVFIFHTPEVLTEFVEKGWEWGGEADAAAKSGDTGAAAAASADVQGGIEVYLLTEAGVALQATVSGTKYWKDDELN